MKVDFAFFAEAAVIQPDGAFHVLNGGIDRGHALTFPANPPTMVLMVKLLAERAECGLKHSAQVTVKNPQNEVIATSGCVVDVPINQYHPDGNNFFLLRLEIQSFVLSGPGIYLFDLFIDDTLLHTIPFEVLQATS